MSVFGRVLFVVLVLSALSWPAIGQESHDVGAEVSPETKKVIDDAVDRALARRQTDEQAFKAKAGDGKSVKADEKFLESNVVSLVGREGFRWQDRDGQFLLNPYILLQTRLSLRAISDAGLDLADPDNLVNLGYGVTNGIIGIAGKAFSKLSFNLALNGALAGTGGLLNEAWLEGNVMDEFRIRVGKFKTPMHWNNQTRLGSKLASFGPPSLTTKVNIPDDINAVNPAMATGFDIGLMIHGLIANSAQYQIGIFNGEGINVIQPTSTLSDDTNIPAWLYTARLAWMPFGPLSPGEGGPALTTDLRLLVAASISYNVETNSESSSDLRSGWEIVLSAKHWYWAFEAYLLQMTFMERMSETPNNMFWGGYTVVAHTFDVGLEPFVRMDVLDRNSVRDPGLLLMSGAGLNWYIVGQNLKLQALYQYTGRVLHADRLSAEDDIADLGLHNFSVQLQFAF